MKICILGLDSATPELAFSDERLANIRRLMELGVYGTLEGVLPPGPVPGWIALAASQDPGSLGMYGLRSRSAHSYSPAVTPLAIQGTTLWDQVTAANRKSVLIAVPPIFTAPAALKDNIRDLVSDCPADITHVPGQSKDDLRDHIFETSRAQWNSVRRLLCEQQWDFFQFVDIGLDRVQRAFWEYCDEQHPRYQPGNPYQDVIPDYYLWLDEQIGSVLELLDPETVLLLASANGMRRLEGGFAINQWLLQHGLLVLNHSASGITAFDHADVDWAKTRAWSDGGPFASLYFNVAGREPQGVVPAAEYELFREQITAGLQGLRDPAGQPLHARVFQPNEIYRRTCNVAPDLMVQLDKGRCSAVATLGHPGLYLADAEGCTPTASGCFVLTAPNCPLAGEYAGARLLDMAPTLLDLAGYDIPASMQGRSLVAGMEKKRGAAGPDGDQIIMDRLAGLGYV